MKSIKNQMPFLIPIMLISISFLTTCGKRLDLGKFDSTEWKSDLRGCNGKRAGQMEALEVVKKEFYGISENQLLQVLGRPDRQELGERNRKNYFYYITPSRECGNGQEEVRLLVVDINATHAISLITTKPE